MTDIEKVISDLEQQIRWIEEIECHQFPGWLNTVLAMKDALELLKEQEAVVRCKECVECYFASNRIQSERTFACGKHGIDVTPDWFCADGERK